jgi:uncharacterized protein
VTTWVPYMDTAETIPSNPRAERFGYVCHRCAKCCHNRYIRINPYEVARLAHNRGMTTSEFRATYTEDGKGVVLRVTESGACVFLGSDGCTVHADRPLVCRLYPLGLQLTPDGAESFTHVDPHPQSRGEFTRRGTIADFLAAQDAQSFIQAARDYYAWLCAAHDVLCQTSESNTADTSAADEDIAHTLLDMDAAIARHCASNRIVEPTDIEARKKLHLTILYQHLEQQQEDRHE